MGWCCLLDFGKVMFVCFSLAEGSLDPKPGKRSRLLSTKRRPCGWCLIWPLPWPWPSPAGEMAPGVCPVSKWVCGFINRWDRRGRQRLYFFSFFIKNFIIFFLKKLEIELPYDPEIPLLGIHTEKTRRERDMCTPMFITALFIIARTWKQPRCPSADEWIKKLWYIYTMEHYSAIKKNTFESVLMRWMKLEPIIQSEVSQKVKYQYSILMHIYGI